MSKQAAPAGVIKQTCDDPQSKDKCHDMWHKDLHNYYSLYLTIAQKNGQLVGKPLSDISDALAHNFTFKNVQNKTINTLEGNVSKLGMNLLESCDPWLNCTNSTSCDRNSTSTKHYFWEHFETEAKRIHLIQICNEEMIATSCFF